MMGEAKFLFGEFVFQISWGVTLFIPWTREPHEAVKLANTMVIIQGRDLPEPSSNDSTDVEAYFPSVVKATGSHFLIAKP